MIPQSRAADFSELKRSMDPEPTARVVAGLTAPSVRPRQLKGRARLATLPHPMTGSALRRIPFSMHSEPASRTTFPNSSARKGTKVAEANSPSTRFPHNASAVKRRPRKAEWHPPASSHHHLKRPINVRSGSAGEFPIHCLAEGGVLDYSLVSEGRGGFSIFHLPLIIP
jgi:hypothetical protein